MVRRHGSVPQGRAAVERVPQADEQESQESKEDR